MSHPEDICGRCGHPNILSWSAPSPLWNAVMRDPVTLTDAYGIVCPRCFKELAEERGITPTRGKGALWVFRPLGMDVTPLWQDRDGRVWDDASLMWVDP